MSLGGYFSDLLQGEPLGTSDAQVAAGDTAEQIIQTGTGVDPLTGQAVDLGDNSNAALIASGAWTQDQIDQSAANMAASQGATNLSGVTDAFTTQLGTEATAIGNAVANPLSFALPKIPLQWWIIGGVVLFFYLGGGGFLARRGRERLSR